MRKISFEAVAIEDMKMKKCDEKPKKEQNLLILQFEAHALGVESLDRSSPLTTLSVSFGAEAL